MAAIDFVGVVPVNKFSFTIAPLESVTNGTKTYGTPFTVSDVENLDIALDNGIEEWYALGEDGWVNRLMTARSITVNMSGKRNYADAGNNTVGQDYFMDVGLANEVKLTITFPNSDTLAIPGVLNITGLAGGATDVDKLEFEIQSNGKPTFTKA